MELRDFLSLVWKRRLVVAVVFATCVALAGLYSFSQPKRYKSTATIVFTPSAGQGQSFIPSDNLSALLSTYAAVAKSDQNLAAARRMLGRPVPGEVSTSTEAGSGVMEISGEDTSPLGAAETASATSQAFVNSIQGNGILVATVVTPPVASDTPLQPRPPLIISLAAVLGLIAGVLLAVALESFRRNVETPAELAELSGLPVIGRLPRTRPLAHQPSSLVWTSSKMGALQESYRALRTNVELLADGGLPILQVTSSDPGHGKSTVVANLAIALGQLGIPTVVVDADLRRPRQHEIFDLDNEVGLSTLMLLPDSGVEPRPTAFDDVSVLTSGPTPPDATEMLHVRFRLALRTLRAQKALVLIDSPPILPVSDARLIASQVDAVLFVAAAGQTRTTSLAAALEKLRFSNANLMGAILNFAERDEEAAGGYGYGYDAPVARDALRA